MQVTVVLVQSSHTTVLSLNGGVHFFIDWLVVMAGEDTDIPVVLATLVLVAIEQA